MVDAQHLIAFCQAQQDWLLGTVESLVKLESPTDDKVAVDHAGRSCRVIF